LFGHFGSTNLGNDATLGVILYHLRRFQPHAEVTCICSVPEAVATAFGIDAVAITENFFPSWAPKHGLGEALRKVLVAIPSEIYRWFRGIRLLRSTDILIIPGTGLLTDAGGLLGWGPYGVFKWCVIAKLSGCEILFVSVGGGPIYSTSGKLL